MNRRSKMKKLIAAFVLAATSMTAMADPHWGGHHGYGHGYGYGGGYYGPQVIHQNNSYYRGSNAVDLLGPMVIGGIVGWSINEASRPRYYPNPVVIPQQPPVIYQQAPSVNYQRCTAWIESVDQYGVTTRTRTCY
jgi:hypothetical protein